MSIKGTYILLVILCAVVAFELNAQPCIPEVYAFESQGDYRIHKNRAEECMDWLLRKPMHKKPEIRAELTAYCMLWLSGAPNDKVYLYSELLPAAETNPDLMFLYAMALHRVNAKHPEYDTVQLQVAALKKVAKNARKSKGLAQNEALEEFLKLAKSDDLEAWVSARMKGVN